MKYLFGPVLSRRLGRSLGIDLIPHKTCTLDCVYCECGATTELTVERRIFVPTEAVLAELRALMPDLEDELDWATFAGSGEPTLATNLGAVIRGAREVGVPRVAVLTNGTLLHREDVVQDLLEADRVCPSLDAATPEIFQAVNRPHPELDVHRIVEALVAFRRAFRGELHLEILLARGINDGPRELEALAGAVRRIEPDVVELGTVARPGTEKWAEAVEEAELRRIGELLPGRVELMAYHQVPRSLSRYSQRSAERILQLLRRRPATADQIATGLRLRIAMVQKALEGLERREVVHQVRESGEVFYRVTPTGEGAHGTG